MAGRSLPKVIATKDELLSSVKTNATIHVTGGFDMLNPTKIEQSIKQLKTKFDIVFVFSFYFKVLESFSTMIQVKL